MIARAAYLFVRWKAWRDDRKSNTSFPIALTGAVADLHAIPDTDAVMADGPPAPRSDGTVVQYWSTDDDAWSADALAHVTGQLGELGWRGDGDAMSKVFGDCVVRASVDDSGTEVLVVVLSAASVEGAHG